MFLPHGVTVQLTRFKDINIVFAFKHVDLLHCRFLLNRNLTIPKSALALYEGRASWWIVRPEALISWLIYVYSGWQWGGTKLTQHTCPKTKYQHKRGMEGNGRKQKYIHLSLQTIYMCIYIYIYIYIYVCVCVCVCIICMYVCMYNIEYYYAWMWIQCLYRWNYK